jgi:galactoside O-acetyltransferase
MFKKIRKTPCLLIQEIISWIEAIFIQNLPGLLGMKIRSLYWALRFRQPRLVNIGRGLVVTAPGNITMGKGINILQNTFLYADSKSPISIGNRTCINSNVTIDSADGGEIVIGDDVLIGPNVILRASDHNYQNKEIPINQQGHSGGKIIIQDDVWIAANVVIVSNVTVGRGAVIGAGSVVTKNVPEYVLAAGVPAKVIKARGYATD